PGASAHGEALGRASGRRGVVQTRPGPAFGAAGDPRPDDAGGSRTVQEAARAARSVADGAGDDFLRRKQHDENVPGNGARVAASLPSDGGVGPELSESPGARGG